MRRTVLGPHKHVLGCALLVAAFGLLAVGAVVPSTSLGNVPLPLDQTLVASKDNQVLVLFAGYPGCSEVCPTAMRKLAVAHQGTTQAAAIGVTFVNLQLDASDSDSLAYAQSFAPEFKGYSLKSAQQQEMYAALAIDGSNDVRELERHRGYVYVFARRIGGWQLEKVYARLPAPQALARQLDQLLLTVRQGATEDA